jgi:amino acid adenylation domain-containing protein/FkbH-like protein
MKVSISATYVVEPLIEHLRASVGDTHQKIELRCAVVDQIIQQLLNPTDEENRLDVGVNVFCIRLSDWGDSLEPIGGGKKLIDKFITLVNQLETQFSSTNIVFISPEMSPLEDDHLVDSIKNQLQPNIACLFHSDICPGQSVEPYINTYTDQQAKIPYTEKYYIFLAKKLTRVIQSLFLSHYKVIVLDCDYTLWHGACSELGPTGVEITKVHKERQRFFKQLKDKGYLICLCSKNSEDDVLDVFRQHHDMILSLNDVSEYRINWLPKAQNIASLSDVLNIGLEHFIFIDDNPTECHEVQRHLPSVHTVIASDRDNLFLFENPSFDKYIITAEDKNRTQFYANEKKRHAQKNKIPTFRDYISDLSLKMCIRIALTEDMTRVVQLCHRTNQFNLSLRRYDNNQLSALIQKKYIVTLVELSDRFGSYGIVGALIYKCMDDYLHVDTFLLSCRVLGRTIEHRMLNFLAHESKKNGLSRIEVDFLQGEKNNVALNSFLSIGGELSQDRDVISVPVELCETAEDNFYKVMENNCPTTEGEKLILLKSQHVEKKILTLPTGDNQSQKIKSSVTLKTNSKIESEVAEIWRRKLNVTIDNLHTSFYQYGGSSIQFVFMLDDIFQNFNVAVPLDEVIAKPTITTIVDYIESHQKTTSNSSKALQTGDNNCFPLSNAQKRIWLSCQNAQDESMYNMFGCWRLQGSLNINFLKKSCQQLVKEHSILRTKYMFHSDQIQQSIVPYADVAEYVFNEIEVNCYSDSQISDWKLNIAQKQLDLLSGKIFQCHLLILKDGSYILALLVHHIVCDGLSLQYMCQLISSMYSSLVGGETLNHHSKLSYFDYIQWESDFCHSERYQKSEKYWLHQLEHLSEFQLPMTEDIVENNFSGEKLEFSIDDHCFKFISEIAKQYGVSVFAVFSTVFDILLYRYSQQENIVTGTLGNGRIAPGSAKSLGFFSNLLVLKSYISDNDTFSELIKRKSDVLIEAMTHQSIPFNHLVEKLKPRRAFGRNPLCQILCVFEEIDTACLSMPDIDADAVVDCNNGILFADFNSARFDLVLYGGVVDGELRCVLEYNKQLFKKIYMQGFRSHFINLLSSIKKDTRIPIGKLALLSSMQSKQLLFSFNSLDIEYPFKDIEDRFDVVAKNSPKKVAVVDEERQITFGVLDKKIKRIASYLESLLGNGNDVIAVIMPRSVASVELMMGVLKAGKIYFPINSSFPNQLIMQMITDAKPALIFCSKEYLIHLKGYNAGKVVVYEGLILPSASNFPTKNSQKKLNMPAYLIYTSGSTGAPKGVLQTRGAISNLINWQVHELPDSSLNFLHMATIGFDVSIQEVLSSLLTGGTLYVIDNNLKKDMFSLVNYIKQHSINILFFPTSLLVFLCEIALKSQCLLPSLQRVIVAGEALKITPPIADFFKINSSAFLVNQYGPTETHVCTSYTLQNSDFSNSRNPPIGVPIDNLFTYVLNGALQPVPLGVPGELYVGGVGVAKEYIHNPELTAEKFVQHLSKSQKNSLYSTGDIVVRMDDGLLRYIGRKDRQVQLRGHRIEISGIEKTLLNYPEISNALVILRGEEENLNLITYFISYDNVEIEAQSIRQYLANIYPCYMVPDLYIQINNCFPLTPNGKIDYDALHISRSNISRHGESSECQPSSPMSQLETVISGMVSKLLDLPLSYIDVNNNFFEFGMHSLHILRLVMLINTTFNIHLSPKDIYFHQNIAMLATCVQESLSGNYAPTFFSKGDEYIILTP